MFRDKGYKVVVDVLGVDGRDVEYVGYYGEYLDVRDGVVGGFWRGL